MQDIFELTTRPNLDIFYAQNDKNDPRLGEVTLREPNHFDHADIVILGYPCDEGIQRKGGRLGAKDAPDAIREQFYKLTTFGVKNRIFDLGDTICDGSLEDIHERHKTVVNALLHAGKRVIVLGGGNDVSFPDGCAMAENFGADSWLAVNVDAHFDVRADEPRNSGTQYRQLLDGGLLRPDFFYEVAFQEHYASPVYYHYLQQLGVNLISFQQLRTNEASDLALREQLKHTFVHRSRSVNCFFGFDMDAVRASGAPGTSAPGPTGLRAGEFLTLVKFAAELSSTRIIEFTEVNPKYDQDDRTAKLVAVAMHKCCALTA